MSVDELFVTALDLVDPVERRHYLDRACASDEPLRREVESLLGAHERIGGFLQRRPTFLAQASESGAAVKGFAEKGGDHIGRYKLLEPIGEGGFGVVWMAEQEEPVRRRVALKIIKLGMDTRSVVARFEAERQALALMDHPHIAKVFDGGATGAGRPYFVMELVKGIPITKYCEECKLSLGERLKLVTQVCRAVQHAHQKGIIHRDLKPSNVLVTEQDGRPVPKVIDFGIAKATEGRLTDKTLFTGFQQWIGTPSYMSPEQAGLASLDIDTRSDVYSLGVLLYELLTGHTPFDTRALLKEGYEAVLRTIRETEPLKPSTRLRQDRVAADVSRLTRESEIQNPKSEIDPDLDWIVMKCLEKDRNRRYDVANSLALDLERYLHHEPVLARPPSATYRWGKFARKHRTAVAVGAGFILLLTGATVVSTTLALWANRERAGAVRAQKAEITHRERAEEASKMARAERDKASQARDAERDARLREEEQRKAAEASQARAVTAEADAKDKELQARTSETTAKENERKAKESEAEARAVIQFFQEKVLAAARPKGQEGGLGRNATIRDALDAAEPTIGSSFTNQPLVEASIRHTLGSTYSYLSHYRAAVVQHEKALAIRKRVLGPDHSHTLGSMNNLGAVYQDAGRLDEALPLLEQVLERRMATLGPDHHNTAESMYNLARAYEAAGRRDEALVLFEKVLKVLQAKRGPDDPDTLTLLALNSLAVLYRQAGRVTNAVLLLEDGVRLCKAKLGAENPQTLVLRNSLAGAYYEADRLADALSQWEESLRACKDKLGPDHSITLSVMNNLALGYREADRSVDALPLLEATVNWCRTKLGPDHPKTILSLYNLGLVHEDLEHHADALRFVDEAVTLSIAKLGADHPDTLPRIRSLARLYWKTGQLAAALPLLEQTLKGRKTRLGPDHFDTLQTMHDLGRALLDGKKFAEAELMLGQAYETLKRLESERSSRSRIQLLKETGERLVLLYETWGKPEQAAEWRKKLNDAPKPPASIQP